MLAGVLTQALTCNLISEPRATCSQSQMFDMREAKTVRPPIFLALKDGELSPPETTNP
jgi:hypothetical protein